MALNKNISFRSYLLGSVVDFVESTRMGALFTSISLANVIVALAHYSEEGKSLSPEIYLTNDATLMLKFLPGCMSVPIGKCTSSDTSATTAIKHCAPLAVEGWCIYVSCGESETFYGIFRDKINPLAIPLEDALLTSGTGPVKIVRIHQSAQNCVDVSNHLGDRHTIFLSQKPETEPSPRLYVDDLAAAMCSSLESQLKEQTQTVIRRTINAGLEASHGSLVAVVDSAVVPACLKDGLVFDQPLDFGKFVEKASQGGEEDKLNLLAHTSVIRGMFGCDGILVFNRKAVLLGYNCFIEAVTASGSPITGGARKRAYAALKDKIGTEIYAGYIRSQDGWSEFKVNPS